MAVAAVDKHRRPLSGGRRRDIFRRRIVERDLVEPIYQPLDQRCEVKKP
jgi:hypothetical protein